jgi:DNA segregation ATPase FtsK/SpoIIIE, S-DNA-T family
MNPPLQKNRRPSSNPKKKTSRGTVQQEVPVVDGAIRFWARFGRFSWDMLGIILGALSLLTLLALFNITEGSLISPWIRYLQLLVGWGSYIAAFVIGLLGIAALKRTQKKVIKVSIWKILAFEGLYFCLLSLLAIFGGHSLEAAENGLHGGVIGWGLAELVQIILPTPISTLTLIIFLLFFIITGFGLIQKLTNKIEGWLFSPENENPSLPGSMTPIHAMDEKAKKAHKKTSAEVKQAEGQAITISHPPKVMDSRDESLPPLGLLLDEQANAFDEDNIHAAASLIEHTLAEFGIPSRVVGFRVGPTVTQFAVEPGYIERNRPDGSVQRQKVRVNQISALSRDLARALSAEQLRIEAPVPGHSFVGIEAPNLKSITVRIKPILESEAMKKTKSPLAIALGQDVSGQPVIADLARMPHLLIAGTTGSGKSVCIQAIATCLVMNNTPDDLRLALLDPKMVELVRFNGLPHLFGKVETDIERMLAVLRWGLAEMETRYRLLESAGARDLENYNRRMKRKNEPPLPRIVILIDELADLMMSAPDQTEQSLVRLAQKARATGIHLVVATQRPSTDVITGLIKANFPARVSFNVASAVDSRVILDTNGAETLLGHGDLLFLNPEVGTPTRSQGVLISDQEIEAIIDFWKQSSFAENISVETPPWEELLSQEDEQPDNLIQQAITIIGKAQRASTSLLQRRLRIGYPRAARLMDELEALEVVGPSQGGGRERVVLIPPQTDDENVENSDTIGNDSD